MSKPGTERDKKKSPNPSGLRVVRMPDTIERVGRSRAQIYRLVAAGAFPAPIKLGANSIAFLESAIDQWIADRVAGKPMQLAGSSIAMTAESRALLEERRRHKGTGDTGTACAE